MILFGTTNSALPVTCFCDHCELAAKGMFCYLFPLCPSHSLTRPSQQALLEFIEIYRNLNLIQWKWVKLTKYFFVLTDPDQRKCVLFKSH